jgi:hypothetical protein
MFALPQHMRLPVRALLAGATVYATAVVFPNASFCLVHQALGVHGVVPLEPGVVVGDPRLLGDPVPAPENPGTPPGREQGGRHHRLGGRPHPDIHLCILADIPLHPSRVLTIHSCGFIEGSIHGTHKLPQMFEINHLRWLSRVGHLGLHMLLPGRSAGAARRQETDHLRPLRPYLPELTACHGLDALPWLQRPG